MKKLKILGIDNDLNILKLYKVILGEDYLLSLSSSAHQGLEKLKRENFNLILTELRLNGFEGLEFIRKIKEINQDYIIIVVSSLKSSENLIELIHLGIKDYLLKPLQFSKLKASIKNNFEKAKKETPQELKKINLELKEKNYQLEEKIKKDIQVFTKLQDQFAHTEKMASIGLFASGIAHELNNPLGIILMNIKLVYDDLLNNKLKVKETRHQHALERVYKATLRTKKILNDLLTFSKPQTSQGVPLDINVVIEEALENLKIQGLLKNIKIIKNYNFNLPHLKGDEDRFLQVFINIITNAEEAMPEGGKLAIITSINEEKVQIEFKDNGCGIKEENLKNIFDPFLSTKDKGIGLGLSVSYGIIKQYQGQIKIESILNRGTKFILIFPPYKVEN
ncbi:MAG: response regulator [Armatimonadetes bacterium]|nr:response regulator [Armatimonadota bacterium]